MIAAMLIMATAPASPTGQDAEPIQEIVVRAKARRCSPSIVGEVLRDPDFARRRAEWQRGTPVRVVVPRNSPYMCLARIAFRLKREGVVMVHFDDGARRPAPPPPGP